MPKSSALPRGKNIFESIETTKCLHDFFLLSFGYLLRIGINKRVTKNSRLYYIVHLGYYHDKD